MPSVRRPRRSRKNSSKTVFLKRHATCENTFSFHSPPRARPGFVRRFVRLCDTPARAASQADYSSERPSCAGSGWGTQRYPSFLSST
jgi:hypothetical protein